MDGQGGNGRPNLGGVKAAITIHFISSSSPSLSPLLLCYFSSPLSSALLSPRLSSATQFGASPPLSTPFSSRPSFTCSLSLLFFFPFISSSLIYASFPTECLFFSSLLTCSSAPLFSLPALLCVQRSRARYVHSSQQNFVSAFSALRPLTCYIPARTRGRKHMHHTHTHTHTVDPWAELNRTEPWISTIVSCSVGRTTETQKILCLMLEAFTWPTSPPRIPPPPPPPPPPPFILHPSFCLNLSSLALTEHTHTHTYAVYTYTTRTDLPLEFFPSFLVPSQVWNHLSGFFSALCTAITQAKKPTQNTHTHAQTHTYQWADTHVRNRPCNTCVARRRIPVNTHIVFILLKDVPFVRRPWPLAMDGEKWVARQLWLR